MPGPVTGHATLPEVSGGHHLIALFYSFLFGGRKRWSTIGKNTVRRASGRLLSTQQ
jgi:hypothetical protein